MTAASHTLWILSVALTTAAADNLCPKGGRIHLDGSRCFWLPEATASWRMAQEECGRFQGGALASVDSLELQHFIHHSFPVEASMWVWLRDQVSAASRAGSSGSQGECAQMTLGTQGRLRKASCAGQYHFLCETEIRKSLPSVDTYLTGLVLMTGIYTQIQMQPLPKVPDTGPLSVEMQLFPGMWFSHAGHLVSVELVVQPCSVSSLARVQILRPYCDPNHHLVPPGCSSLLNPFSCCSASPLCNTTGGCSRGQYWCHLTETCVSNTSPCSPYDAATDAQSYALPPRYPAVAPFYHLVADFPLRLNKSVEHKTISLFLPDQVISVYPDDIVAIQHTRDSGTMLHCLSTEASLNSPWRQSYLSFRGSEWTGWWEASVPPGGQWVDGVICDLRMLYVDSLHQDTDHNDDFGFTRRETTTTPDIGAPTTAPPPNRRSKFWINVIHPVPDENNQIHIQINVPVLIVVKVLSGQKAWSSWSAPIHQTGVPFLPSCPDEAVESWPGCNGQFHDDWFSSVTLVLPSVAVQTLNISVTDAVNSQSMTLTVCGYEAVTGLSVEPYGCLRTLVDTPQSFTAKVESGSSVKFTWVIDSMDKVAHNGESYHVMFKKPAEYKLKVTASNPVSSQSQQMLLTADEVTPLTEPEFLFARNVVAVDVTHLYTLRVKVDIALQVTFRWDFGDGSSKLIHSRPAPCRTMAGIMKNGEKQVYIQDSVNYTYSIPDDYTLQVQVSSQYDNTEGSMKISVRPQLSHLFISSSPPMPVVKQRVLLEASTEPSTNATVYTWDFGDGSEVVQHIHSKISHTFASEGIYNITVYANNSLTVLTTWIIVEVMEKISGLSVNYSGPSELGSATYFRATVATGSRLKWKYDFGDGSLLGNLTDGSIYHIYKLSGNYTVDVSVTNCVSQAHRSISIEVYKLAISGVVPQECVICGRDIELNALVNGNISFLTFHWLFGDESPQTIIKGQSIATHKFQKQGIYNISLTVFSSVTSVSLNAALCVEVAIESVTIESSQEIVRIGEEVCFRALVFPEQITGYQLKWHSSPSSQIARAEKTQRCFIFNDEGVEEVSVMASNKVSNQTAEASITIQSPVKKLSVASISQGDTMMVNTVTSFWVSNCIGSNVSVLWDFGDGSPLEQKQNVSHVFTTTGEFTVTATAFNAVSRDSVTRKVKVFHPVLDLSLHTNQSYAVVGEETLFYAFSSATSSTNYYWTVDGINSTKQGTYQFRFSFLKPGVYQVSVIAQNLVSRKDASLLIEAFERIEGLRIECQTIKNMKFIPVSEKLLFIPSITKGSNVTYHWLATQPGLNQKMTCDGEFFQMIIETPGGVSVHLNAFNKLGESASIISLVAVQHVTSALITTQSTIVASGKEVNISVSVTAGSDLQYLWYVDSNHSPVQTHTPFLLHTFTYAGHFFVKVSVQNVLSQSNATKEFTIQEEVQGVDFEIKGKTHPFYITTSAAVPLYGLVQMGSDLHWNWKIQGSKPRLFNITDQSLIYSFPYADIYQVSLNVSNGINWQMVSHSVIVQDAIKDLILNISKYSSCTGEEVTFTASISNGSNARFFITFRNQDWVYSQDIPEGQFTTSSLPAGTNLITVKAWNLVSSAEVSTNILVTENIQGLRLVDCCSAAFEAQKGNHFKSDVQSGVRVNYTWIFNLVGFEPIQLGGQEVIFTPPGSGSLSVSVLATNGVCSKSVNYTATVQWPAKKARIVCHSNRIFVRNSVLFSLKVDGGSNLSFIWDFGDSTKALMTDLNIVNHTYYRSGKYGVMVKVLNNVSHISSQLHVLVEELLCSSPQASLVPSPSTLFRSRPSFFEAIVDANCSAYKTSYLWEILGDSSCTDSSLMVSENKVTLRGQIDVSSPRLLLPKHILNTGKYCLVFTVSLQGTPLLVQQKTTITVVNSPLVAVIKGGSKRLWPGLNDLILDGSESRDPDKQPGEEDTLQYDWTFMTLNSPQTQFIKQPIGNKSSRVTVCGTQLRPGRDYIFTLTVYKTGRRAASVNQTVSVCEAPVLPLTLECVSCSDLASPYQLVSHTIPIILSGQCGQCDDEAQYVWSAEDQSGKALVITNTISTGERNSPNLEMHPGVLQPGQSYTFTLNVSQPDRGQWGSASIMIVPNTPPHGGLCDLSPESDIHLLETVVTYNCSGWQHDESRGSQLIYTFQVEPCQPNGAMCPLLTLYRGTRSKFGSLLPMGSPGQERNMSVITVTLLIEDHLGTKVIALNRKLAIKNPVGDYVASQWLRERSQTELWALVQHGNPQKIIPYSIALTSQLNKLESEQTARDLKDKREIRKNVTQALTSLPVSSMLDVDQISSALLQSTAVPGELVCENCQENVLETVGKMIHVMEEQRRPGGLSSVETGRNILLIIGNTLAALSESVNSPSPQQAYSSTLQSASLNTLSALGHAGTLMRSLMHFRVHGQPPVLLSNPFINTAGFRGDASKLLCTEQGRHSNHNQMIQSQTFETSSPCPFHIPNSFTAHLKSHKTEVVQVMFGMEAELGSNPLLTAADPPISTNVVAMELTTPQGKTIPIQDLDPEESIRVTLPNKYPVEKDSRGGERRIGEASNGTCLTVTLPSKGKLNFTVKSVSGLDENAGLYITLNFSLAPGATRVNRGYIKIEVGSTVPGTNASQDSLVRECTLNLSSPTNSSVESIFLSPLLNGTDRPLSVNLTSHLVDGGPVQVLVCVFSSLCRYYNVIERRWSSEGLQPLGGSTLHEAHCLTQHLTIFGASLFVHPGAVVLLPPPAGPVLNMVVAIVCVVLLLIHLLLGLIGHKLDHVDSLRLSQVPLCGRPGLYHYRVLVKTGWKRGAGTTAHVGISLYGVNKSGCHHLQRDGAFQRGSLDQFHLETDDSLGEVWKIRIWHDNTGLDPSWYIQHVVVWDPQTDHMFFFVLEEWLSVDNHKNSAVEKEVLAACPKELTQFRRVFTLQLMFGMFDRHLWLSLWERPTHSRFTRGQRVACSAVTLHLYLALGALWYGAIGTEGQSGPVSAQVLVNMETVAMGMTIAVLVLPLQCFLCFLFRKADSQVVVDTSGPPSPTCQSVEMDVHLSQSELFSPSCLSLPDSSGPVRDSPSSLPDSKTLDTSILDFWAASGLAPQADGACQEEQLQTWTSYDSLFNLPVDPGVADTTPAPNICESSPGHGLMRQLRRKKALMQRHLPYPSSTGSPSAQHSNVTIDQNVSSMSNSLLKSSNPKLKTRLTLSEEDLMMSIAAADDTADRNNSYSDSGWDSPRTISSHSNMSTSCSSWSEQSEDKSECGAEISTIGPRFCPSLYDPGLYRCSSLLSVDSMASTFLPLSPDYTRLSSTTRIGVARGQPRWLLPPWVLCVIYPLVAVLLGACLAVIGLYGSFLSRTVVLMWLVSAVSAFLTSAVLLEPLKVFVQALICTALWRPVDPEVEDQLAQETTVVRTFGEHSRKVWPPCGYGLLQAKAEARKVQALRSLMRHCVCQLLFLLLLLMVNYQDNVEQRQGRLLHSTVKRCLQTAPSGIRNLTSLRDWSDAEQWITHLLEPHLHQNPALRLVGVPRLQYTQAVSPLANVLVGDTVRTELNLTDLKDWSKKHPRCEALSIDFTHYYRVSGLFVCVSIQLERVQTQGITASLFIRPLLIPSSSSGLDLQVALTVLLFVSALLILFGELWSVAAEGVQCLHQCKHWLQLVFALFSLTAAILQICFLSQANSCVSKLQSQPDSFINFHHAAVLAQRGSHCSAILLTLLVLRLLGALRFVRRWVVLSRVLQRASKGLWAVIVLLILLLVICIHLGKMLFSHSVEGFSSLRQASVFVLSILRGCVALQGLCRTHPFLGPLYGLLLIGGAVWLLARLYGAVLIQTYRAEQAEQYNPTTEFMDYEMAEFFIKRLKLWIGLTKPKEFRHRVKFKGMDVPPSRLSQETRFSTLSYSLTYTRSLSPFSHTFSPSRPFSSALSVRSEESATSESGFEVQPYLDRLLPSVSSLLSHFDQVNQITEDVHNLEIRLEDALAKRRKSWINSGGKAVEGFRGSAKPAELEEGGQQTGDIKKKKASLHPRPRVSLPSSFAFNSSTSSASRISPRARASYSESESIPSKPQASSNNHIYREVKLASGVCSLHTGGSPVPDRFPRRRAWHSGSSHSADAAQRIFLTEGGDAALGNDSFTFTDTRPRSEEGTRGYMNGGVPVKRKAWIVEGSETEQDSPML